MIENKLISKEQINIVVILNKEENKRFFEEMFEYVSLYLKLDIKYINIDKFKTNFVDGLKTSNQTLRVDFFFVDFNKDYEYIFAWNFYSKMHELNKNFKLVLFNEKITDRDIQYFKNGADDIIYTSPQYYEDKNKYLKWKIFSLLRRRWDYAHNETILNRNGVIIDLIKHSVIINNINIKITRKEFEVLSILIDNFNKDNTFVSKNKIFKKIYGIDNNDNSRNIDQLIFRLKNKFPENFFEFDKKKNIRIA